MRRNIFIILAVILFLNLSLRIYQYRSDYLIPFNAAYWQERYENSQWSTKPACSNLNPHINPYTCQWDDNWNAHHEKDKNAIYLKRNDIGDDGLYTYAGWIYIHGHDPTTINAEVPPFGKYLIGLSELVFHNQNIFALVSTLFLLVALYLLNTVLIKDKLLAFVPIVLFSFDPLFYTQLNTTLLDTLYLDLLLLVFYFLIRKQIVLSVIFLGLMAATKSTLSTFLVVVVVVVVYLLISKQNALLKKYLISLPIAFLVVLCTYVTFFINGNSLRAFFGVQKWVYTFYSTGAKGSFITPWEIMFTGKWHTWWGTYVPADMWHFGWYFLLVLTIFAMYLMIRTQYKKPILLTALWIIIYLIFLSFIPTWPRYLLLVLPFMYNLSSWVTIYKILKVKKGGY